MPKLIISLLLWTGALMGLGWGVERWVLFKAQKTRRCAGVGRLLFLGFWGVAFIAQFIHLFIPLSQVVGLALLFLGWGIVYQSRLDLKGVVQEQGLKEIVGLGLIVSLVAWICYHNIDTGYYHLPTISVLSKYPLLPGLANVFGPYGHNSTWFAIEAIFSLPYLGLSSTFVANSVFVLGFLLFLSEVFLESSQWSFCFFIGLIFSFNHVALGLGGVSPDLSVTLLSSWVWFCFLESIFGEKKFSEGLLPYLPIYLTLALSIKVSALNLLLPAAVIVLVHREQFKLREMQISVLLSLLFLNLWLMRSVILSGCVLYPESLTCFENLAWAMPLEEVTAWYRDIKKHLCGFAILGTIFSHPECFKEWTVRVKNDPIWKSSAGVTLVFYILFFYNLFTKSNRVNRIPNFKAIAGVVLVSAVLVAVWLFSAPNLRFALWLVVAVVGGIVALAFEWQGIAIKRHRPFFGCLVILALGISFRSAWVTRPIPLNWKEWPVLPERSFKEVISSEGFMVSQPLHDFRCFDISPPCTPQKSDFSIHRKWNRVWFKAGR